MRPARELRSIPLSLIDCEAQVRVVEQQGLDGLAQSLVSVGLQQPIVVRPRGERFVVIDGERRLSSARLAGWESIDAFVVDEPLNDGDRIVYQLVANCHREGLSAIELARAIESLRKATGCKSSEAASKLGFKAAAVSKLETLLTLPAVVQDAIHAGHVKPSTAYLIAKTKDTKRRAQLIARALRGGLKRDDAARESRAAKACSKSGKRQLRRVTVAVSEGRRVMIVGGSPSLGGLLGALDEASAQLREFDPSTAGAALLSALDALSGRRRVGFDHQRDSAAGNAVATKAKS